MIYIEYRVKRKTRTPISIVFKARYKNKADKLQNLQPENFEILKENKVSPIQEENKASDQNKEVAKKWLNQIKNGGKGLLSR